MARTSPTSSSHRLAVNEGRMEEVCRDLALLCEGRIQSPLHHGPCGELALELGLARLAVRELQLAVRDPSVERGDSLAHCTRRPPKRSRDPPARDGYAHGSTCSGTPSRNSPSSLQDRSAPSSPTRFRFQGWGEPMLPIWPDSFVCSGHDLTAPGLARLAAACKTA